MEEDSKGTGLGNVIRIDDERIRDHLGKIVRGSVVEANRRVPPFWSSPRKRGPPRPSEARAGVYQASVGLDPGSRGFPPRTRGPG